MKILEQVLCKIKSIRKNKREFLITLVRGFIGAMGKRTFRNLSRYLDIEEHTISRQMTKEVDFVAVNTEMIMSTKNGGDIMIASHDSTFVPKSGKKTDGLDFFWNGCAGKAEKGLEVDVIAVIVINGEKKEGIALSAKQNQANPIPKRDRKNTKGSLTKIDDAVSHLAATAPHLQLLGIRHISTDAYFSKTKYIDGATNLGLHVVGKLRCDAQLHQPYLGPQKARGRKKKRERIKVNPENLGDALILDDGTELRSFVAYNPTFGHLLNVVHVMKVMGKNKYGEALLFSTDLALTALQIYQFYTARFQIEFIFRDAKNFTGFADCQSRDKRRLHYHFNVSLLALNVAKLQDRVAQQNSQKQHAFSMANWNRKYHVDIIINRIISIFGLEQTSIKLNPNYQNMLAFGSIHHANCS